MGRFSRPLAAALLERVVLCLLDSGPWTSARDRVRSTAQLVDRLGADAVAAIDPSEPFVTALASAPAGRRRTTGWSRVAALGRRLVRPGHGQPRRQLHDRARTGAARDGSRGPRRRHGGGDACGTSRRTPARSGSSTPPPTTSTRPRPTRSTCRGRGPAALAHLVRFGRPRGASTSDRSSSRWPSGPSTSGGSRSPTASGPSGAYVATLDDEHRAAVRRRCAERIGLADETAAFELPVRARCVVARA